MLADSVSSQAARELKPATGYRRWFNRRQLYELIAEFWTMHFNILQDTGPVRLGKIVADREVIRLQAATALLNEHEASQYEPDKTGQNV